MILDSAEILDILSKNPAKKLLDLGTEQRKTARMHMYGVDMEHNLAMIEGFEKPWLQKIRVKYVQSNKDIMTRAAKPISKVFTARGSSSYYNMTEKENYIAASISGNILSGMSVKKWIETFWKYRVLDDPMGLIYMEIDSRGNVFPTCKHVDSIKDYKLNGDKLEYVIFNVTKEEKIKLGIEDEGPVFRVVDDLFDRIIIYKDAKEIEIVDNQTFINYFGFVPGMINSPFINPDGEGFVSAFYPVFDLANQYLLKISIRLTHELRHGFPKYWEYADECIKCKGNGKVLGITCTECNGTGKKLMTYVSDMKAIEYPTKDTPQLKGNPGGYIEPSKIFWEIVTAGLAELEERITQTMWGSKTSSKMKPGMGLSAGPNGIVTATEVMDNRQPEIECLNAFSDAAEKRDKFITDCAITVKLRKRQYVSMGGCSKNYGRRFLIEEPDALLSRYMEARKNGVSPSILYGLYEQYLESKYQSDGVSLSLHKKLLKIEPFFHYTLDEVKRNGMPPEDIRAKMYYGEWFSSIENNKLIMMSVEELKESFATFVSTKPLPEETMQEEL